MNNIKDLCRLLLVTGAVIFFSLNVTAQRGRSNDRGGTRFENRGGGRFYDQAYHNNYSRNYYQGGNYFRGGYYNNRPAYGYGNSYNYYPSYQYRPIYRSYGYLHFGPAFGFRLSILPFGYSPFFIGNNPYYYNEGIYYRPYSNGGYEVTAPPLGATVKHLPSGAKANVINGQKYYELGGTYYQQEITAKNKLQYVVVGTDGVINTTEPGQNQAEPQDQNNRIDNTPPLGNAPDPSVQPSGLTQLPANSKIVTINRQKFYLAPSGVYYQEITDASNNVSYEAVGSEGSIPDKNIIP